MVKQVEEYKICIRCEQLKSDDEFRKHNETSDHLQSWCKECHYKYILEQRSTKKGKDDSRKYELKKKFKITPEQYQKIFIKQGGCCAICGIHQSKLKKALAVDHNHDTEIVRGLLCSNCNMAIGLLYDDPLTLLKAVDYLTGVIDG